MNRRRLPGGPGGLLGPLVRLLVLLLGGAWAGAGALAADPPGGEVAVPDVRRLAPEEAARRLARVGLNAGRVYEVAVPQGWQRGLVVQQAPAPWTASQPAFLPFGAEVALAVAAERAGPAQGRAPPPTWPRVRVAPLPAPLPRGEAVDPLPPPPPPPPPPLPAPPEGVAQPAARAAPDSSAPREPQDLPPAGALPPPTPLETPAEESGPAPAAGVQPPTLPDPPRTRADLPLGERPIALGSPDAPALAALPDPTRTPALVGLTLVDAEERARLSELTLHVERVPGHPAGRVLEQDPAPDQPRPPGGLVRVLLAAGGDLPAALAPPPLVEVSSIAVPDLLDRTGPQAVRILEDTGLLAALEEAARGPAGRVVDQRPAPGTVVPKGALVIVRVAPGEGKAPRPATAPPAPGEPPGIGTSVPTPTAPPERGELSPPEPTAPLAGTDPGQEATLALGLMWRPVPGADAYLVEVEEETQEGWIGIARQVVRRPALALDVERVSPVPGALRWRVAALAAGRRGPPAAWIVLR